MRLDGALAQLRHLYAQMLSGDVRDTAEAARGLLGPAIERIEVSAAEFRALHEAVHADVKPNEALVEAFRGHR